MQKLLKFAEAFYKAANADKHRWAAGIVNQAFQQVMGRPPTPAERQIVQAVSWGESNYGAGWGKGKSTGGQGSNNWGAVQTRSKTAPGFTHGDSSSEGKYQVRFKTYPSPTAGAADVVKLLFKGGRKQQFPDASRGQRTFGGPIPGSPGRGELVSLAAQQGDTMAFSRAMWYTTYFEGFKPDFTENIKAHANMIQKHVNAIATANNETPAWSMKTQHFLPVTNDQSVIPKVLKVNPKAAGSGGAAATAPPAPTQIPFGVGGVRPGANVPLRQQQSTGQLPMAGEDLGNLESMLWFQ
jgi:hypothetical protein